MCIRDRFYPIATGAVLTLLILLVIRGGLGRIAKVTERLVPVSAGIYTVISLIVIMSYYDRLPSVLLMILESAWKPSSALSGAAGYGISVAVRYGVSRGVFSNEAGLGSLAVIHGAVEETTPEKQGMWAMFEVFFDTIISCSPVSYTHLIGRGGPSGGYRSTCCRCRNPLPGGRRPLLPCRLEIRCIFHSSLWYRPLSCY